MDKKAIENEIVELKKVKSLWTRTMLNKSQVRDLVTKIGIFNHTFSVKFPNSVEHYRKNRFAEIQITDAISELEHYSKSKLKQKDNHYFYDGMKNLKWGIDTIISKLEREIENE